MEDSNSLDISHVLEVWEDFMGSMVPTRTGKKGKLFPVREKSQGILNRLEKSGNFTQNTGKIRKFYPEH